MFNTSATSSEYSPQANRGSNSNNHNDTRLDDMDASFVHVYDDQLAENSTTTENEEILSGKIDGNEYLISWDGIFTNASDLSGFTTDSQTYEIRENSTRSQPSFEAFVPLTNLGLPTTRQTPNDSDPLLGDNYTWNKAGFNITFNFTGNLSVSDWNTTETSQHHLINWFLLALCIVPTWILFGNMLVLLAVIYHRNLRTLSNLVIASLAVTDFLLALIVVPFGTYQVVSKLFRAIITLGYQGFEGIWRSYHLIAVT